MTEYIFKLICTILFVVVILACTFYKKAEKPSNKVQ